MITCLDLPPYKHVHISYYQLDHTSGKDILGLVSFLIAYTIRNSDIQLNCFQFLNNDLLRHLKKKKCFFFFCRPGHNAGNPIYLRLFTFIYIGSPSIITIMHFIYKRVRDENMNDL